MKNDILVIIIPCYNEEEVIEICYKQISSVLNDLIIKEKISNQSYICFIDDGSNDSTWKRIELLSAKGIKFTNNFGYLNALYAGLTLSDADIFITMDADLQDDINLIEKMVDKYNNGNEIVYAVRSDRKTDTYSKRFFAENYYRLCSILGLKVIFNHADFRLVSSKITKTLKHNPQLHLRWILPSLGFKSECVYYSRFERVAGNAKFTFTKSLKLAIEGIAASSNFPIFKKILNLLFKKQLFMPSFKVDKIKNETKAVQI